jgi:hypothetical protein
VFVVADGGADLERFELRTLAEARSILLQVPRAQGPAACAGCHQTAALLWVLSCGAAAVVVPHPQHAAAHARKGVCQG